MENINNNNNLKNQNEYGNNQEIVSTIKEINIKPKFKDWKDEHFFDKFRKIKTKEELDKQYKETLKHFEDKYKDLQKSIKETMDNILKLLEKDREEEGKHCLTFMRGPIVLKLEFDEMKGDLNFEKSCNILKQNKEKYLTAYENIKKNYTNNKSEEFKNKYLEFSDFLIDKLNYEDNELTKFYKHLEEIYNIGKSNKRRNLKNIALGALALESLYDLKELEKYKEYEKEVVEEEDEDIKNLEEGCNFLHEKINKKTELIRKFFVRVCQGMSLIRGNKTVNLFDLEPIEFENPDGKKINLDFYEIGRKALLERLAKNKAGYLRVDRNLKENYKKYKTEKVKNKYYVFKQFLFEKLDYEDDELEKLIEELKKIHVTREMDEGLERLEKIYDAISELKNIYNLDELEKYEY